MYLWLPCCGERIIKVSSKFIVFEGIDGAGKSTIATSIVDKLRANDHKVYRISLSDLAKQKSDDAVRMYLDIPGTVDISSILDAIHKVNENIDIVKSKPKYNMLVFAYNGIMIEYFKLAQVVSPILKDKLDNGITVIADRWVMSSVAYNGGVKKTFMRKLMKTDKEHEMLFILPGHPLNDKERDHFIYCNYFSKLATDVLVPDYTFYVYATLETCLKRLYTRAEQEGKELEVFEDVDRLELTHDTYEYLYESFNKASYSTDIKTAIDFGTLVKVYNIASNVLDMCIDNVYNKITK